MAEDDQAGQDGKIVERRLSAASVDKMEEDQKEKIIVEVSTEKLPEVNFQNY